VLSILDIYLDKNHHIYQDNFYNRVKLANTLLDSFTIIQIKSGFCNFKRK
jgi:hypothetical protein